MSDQLSFRFEAPGHFVAELGGVEVAFAETDLIAEKSILIKHTEVIAAHEGRGYGSALVRHILGAAREQGKTVIPICPFAREYLRRHPEHIELVRPDYRAAVQG